MTMRAVALALCLGACVRGTVDSPCVEHEDCGGGLVCDFELATCAVPGAADLRANIDDLRSEPRDLGRTYDLRPGPPDLSPMSCVFDRDCGTAAARCCAGTCKDFLDRSNCGECGRSCGSDPAVVCCSTGAKPADAHCVGVKTDPAHCGRCGRMCGGRSCEDGECK